MNYDFRDIEIVSYYYGDDTSAIFKCIPTFSKCKRCEKECVHDYNMKIRINYLIREYEKRH